MRALAACNFRRSELVRSSSETRSAPAPAHAGEAGAASCLPRTAGAYVPTCRCVPRDVSRSSQVRHEGDDQTKRSDLSAATDPRNRSTTRSTRSHRASWTTCSITPCTWRVSLVGRREEQGRDDDPAVAAEAARRRSSSAAASSPRLASARRLAALPADRFVGVHVGLQRSVASLILGSDHPSGRVWVTVARQPSPPHLSIDQPPPGISGRGRL
jgi:hypothetical protein